MAIGKAIEYILVTTNTDGEEIVLSDFVYDPKDLIAMAGNHQDETIIRIFGDTRTPFMKWDSENHEWQLLS